MAYITAASGQNTSKHNAIHSEGDQQKAASSQSSQPVLTAGWCIVLVVFHKEAQQKVFISALSLTSPLLTDYHNYVNNFLEKDYSSPLINLRAELMLASSRKKNE